MPTSMLDFKSSPSSLIRIAANKLLTGLLAPPNTATPLLPSPLQSLHTRGSSFKNVKSGHVFPFA